METLDTLLQSENDELLATLDEYQRDIIKSFLASNSNDYLDGADKWLNATTSNTAKFGGTRPSKLYRDKVLEELEKFLCGDEAYSEERKKLGENTSHPKEYLIGLLSAAIGKTLGVAGTFIAPVIVLLLMSCGKMAVNAWCAMRKDIKTQGSSST